MPGKKRTKKSKKKESATDVRRKAIDALLADNDNGGITPADLRACFTFVLDAIEQETKQWQN